MIGEPWFWRDEGVAARTVCIALTPLAFFYEQASAARRRFTTPWRASAPVICVGAASVGGVGKTPFAITLGRLLKDAGYAPHFLSRGYGGAVKGPMRVDPKTHRAAEVGDEPLLLAKQAPTWVSRSKRLGAEAAIAAGADVIVMDDGFQNPTIEKDFAILLIDAGQSRGNGRIFPAGPMREPLADAQKRADAVVEITAAPDAPTSDPSANYTAWLEPETIEGCQKALAFCGIANPGRFFDTLKNAGVDVADAVAFPDHYAYSGKDIAALKKRANKLDAALITTEKDWVRINAEQRDAVKTLPVRMRLSDADALLASIVSTIENRREETP